MRSRKFIVGSVALAALALVSLLGTVTGHDDIADAARTVLLVMVGVLVLGGVISQRRSGRRVDYIYRKGVPQRGELEDAAVPPEVAQDDLVGMLRLVQAQYVGRLDRALSALEHATVHLTTSTRPDRAFPARSTVLTVAEPRDEYAPIVEVALESGVEVVVAGATEDAQQWVERRGWEGRVVLAGPRSAEGTTPTESRES